MATRSRTLLFLQYRNTLARSSHRGGAITSSYHADAETEGLIDSSDTVIEMSTLPPKWVDIVDEVEEDIKEINEKINRLDGMHRKHLLPGFDDRSSDEAAIEALTEDITMQFHSAKNKIKRIGAEGKRGTSHHEQQMSINIQTSLASKVQEISSSFRKKQSAYLQKMQGQENRKNDILGLESSLSAEAADLLLTEDANMGFTESQLAMIESSEQAIDQREREINQIAKSIYQLADIFRDLQTLVIDQGTMLDRIDYNIEQTNVQVKHAVVELDQVRRARDHYHYDR
ncbi:t-SNARE [Umbelopsis sp. PMI_123]|nr:t-SNARE [Umbelopsis sp. PMI_123]